MRKSCNLTQHAQTGALRNVLFSARPFVLWFGLTAWMLLLCDGFYGNWRTGTAFCTAISSDARSRIETTSALVRLSLSRLARMALTFGAANQVPAQRAQPLLLTS